VLVRVVRVHKTNEMVDGGPEPTIMVGEGSAAAIFVGKGPEPYNQGRGSPSVVYR
jgi:hypothetical protein